MTEATRSYDAVIVGSGFGGSINALRLAEAECRVLVLERGRRYPFDTFPRDVENVDEMFWRYPRVEQSQGLYDVRFFSGLGVVAASGVGGGSLIYANINVRPDAEVFDDPRWPAELNRANLDPYYDRVATVLGVAPVPEEIRLPKRDRLRAAAEALGREWFDPDQSVSWHEASGPGRQPCQLVTECEFGCPHGAKNTLDLTYLARAEELGAEVRPRCHVTHLEPIADGYRIHYRDLATGERRTVTGRCTVLAAGTLGTNEILLRCRDRLGTLPRLSPRLGEGFSANGDFLGSVQSAQEELEPWRGPDVTTVVRFGEPGDVFTLAAPTFSRPVMEVLASLGQAPVHWGRFLSPALWPFIEPLLLHAFRKGLFSEPLDKPGPHAGPPGRMTNLFAIGRDNAGGRMVLRRDRIDVRWRYARENKRLVRRMITGMQQINDAGYGGRFDPLFFWGLFRRIFTVHPLGGCRVGETPETGVVSPWGEAHGHPGLFVADGSVIPTALGFHPAMTIAAVSERISEAASAHARGNSSAS